MFLRIVYIYLHFILLALVNPEIHAQDFGWQLKKSGSVTGYPISYDMDSDSVFIGIDSILYRSDSHCRIMTRFGNSIPNVRQIKVLFRSSLRPDEFLVATQQTTSNTGQIYKSFDNCQSWNLIGNYNFAYFGIPVTQDHNNPDLFYTMNDNAFQKSTDFGSTWIDISINLPFGAPCDIEVFKDSSNIILVGENAQGIFRSSDYGITWSQTHSTSGEIPTIAIQKTETNVAFATRWAGLGGVLKSTDHGLTWNQIPGPMFNNFGMWGVDILEADSSYIAAGEFSPTANIFISSDYGANWITVPNVNQPNYALKYINDSILIAASGNGIYKLRSLPITNETQIKLVFSIDINDAVDFNTKIRIDTIANGVWIKGDLNALGANQGNWTFSDTTNGHLLPLKDDGTGYDSIANDNIWTIELDLLPGEMVGNFSYRYGISYPGVDTVNNGIAYLNNDSPDLQRIINFQETDTTIVLQRDHWDYTIRPIIFVSDTIINVQLKPDQSLIYPITVSNEQGTDTLRYSVQILSDSIANLVFGSDSVQSSQQNYIYGNIFYTDRNIIFENFEQYIGVSSTALVTFLIYEADSSLQYKKIVSRSKVVQPGTNFWGGSAVNLLLDENKYYLIGFASTADLEIYSGKDTAVNNVFAQSLGSIKTEYNNVLPDTLNIGVIDEELYNQKVYFSPPTKWIDPTSLMSTILPGESENINFNFNSNFNQVGEYKASMILESNDFIYDSIKIPVIFTVFDATSVTNIEIIPERYNLFQNYPNPFNPSTIIRYQIPDNGYVTLKVFDVLGSEVATLVNEYKNTGSYEVEFNGRELTSGIYFYQFKSNNIVQTKKMILLK